MYSFRSFFGKPDLWYQWYWKTVPHEDFVWSIRLVCALLLKHLSFSRWMAKMGSRRLGGLFKRHCFSTLISRNEGPQLLCRNLHKHRKPQNDGAISVRWQVPVRPVRGAALAAALSYLESLGAEFHEIVGAGSIWGQLQTNLNKSTWSSGNPPSPAGSVFFWEWVEEDVGKTWSAEAGQSRVFEHYKHSFFFLDLFWTVNMKCDQIIYIYIYTYYMYVLDSWPSESVGVRINMDHCHAWPARRSSQFGVWDRVRHHGRTVKRTVPRWRHFCIAMIT